MTRAAKILVPLGNGLKVKVFYHNKCFDGASSAALFSRFYRERIRSDVDFEFSGLLHRAGALFDESHFDGDENAIVDFKYSSSPKITWWFDHHESAFLSPADAAHFERDDSNRKFYDPAFKSCTSFIAMIGQQRFGFDPAPVADLVRWSDVIDGALYSDAKTAVEMQEPAMKLTMVIESAPDQGFVPHLIPLLATKPLAAILEEPFVAPLLPPLLKRHLLQRALGENIVRVVVGVDESRQYQVAASVKPLGRRRVRPRDGDDGGRRGRDDGGRLRCTRSWPVLLSPRRRGHRGEGPRGRRRVGTPGGVACQQRLESKFSPVFLLRGS